MKEKQWAANQQVERAANGVREERAAAAKNRKGQQKPNHRE
jgi:hypothetical protein